MQKKPLCPDARGRRRIEIATGVGAALVFVAVLGLLAVLHPGRASRTAPAAADVLPWSALRRRLRCRA